MLNQDALFAGKQFVASHSPYLCCGGGGLGNCMILLHACSHQWLISDYVNTNRSHSQVNFRRYSWSHRINVFVIRPGGKSGGVSKTGQVFVPEPLPLNQLRYGATGPGL